MAPTTSPLLRGLVDDAAVFPPGNAPLEVAVARHAGHREAGYAGCVGPLLLPPSAAGPLPGAVETHWPPAEPLRVVLVSRPGAPVSALTEAVERLATEKRVEVAGVELGWTKGWRALAVSDLPVAVEVPRGAEQSAALEDIARARDDASATLGGVAAAPAERASVVAKFRTGPTPTWPWPEERELAEFLVGAVARGLPFRLTGGLHHAVRATYPPGTATAVPAPEENHGVLDVLLATRAALDGAGPAEVAEVLGRRDGVTLAAEAMALDDDAAARVRAAFTAYGCCEVTDPIGELADLGLDVGSAT